MARPAVHEKLNDGSRLRLEVRLPRPQVVNARGIRLQQRGEYEAAETSAEAGENFAARKRAVHRALRMMASLINIRKLVGAEKHVTQVCDGASLCLHRL